MNMPVSPNTFPAGMPDHAALRFVAENGGALCTVVGIEGHWSRRLGAQLALGADGSLAGDLADHCLNEELRSQVVRSHEAGQPFIVRYGQGSTFIDFKLPCGAGIDILVDATPDRKTMVEAARRLDLRAPATVNLPNVSQMLLNRRHYVPSLRILCFGAEAESAALGGIARQYGAHFEHRKLRGLSDDPADDVDRWTAILCLSHDHDWERVLLPWALKTDAFFVGAIGGAQTRQARAAMLAHKGFSDSQIDRVRHAVGLFPRARNPTALAFSVMAQLVHLYEGLIDQ